MPATLRWSAQYSISPRRSHDDGTIASLRFHIKRGVPIPSSHTASGADLHKSIPRYHLIPAGFTNFRQFPNRLSTCHHRDARFRGRGRPSRCPSSLIGRLGSSAFRLSTNSSVDVAHGLALLFGLGT